MTDWFEITRRNARSVQTTIGWIFWDPGGTRRYVELGLPEQFAEPLGYIASRCAPLAGAGPDAVIAAFGSISPMGIRAVPGATSSSACPSSSPSPSATSPRGARRWPAPAPTR